MQQVTSVSMARNFAQEVLNEVREARQVALPNPTRNLVTGMIFTKSIYPKYEDFLQICCTSSKSLFNPLNFVAFHHGLVPGPKKSAHSAPGIPVFGNTGAGKSTLLNLGEKFQRKGEFVVINLWFIDSDKD